MGISIPNAQGDRFGTSLHDDVVVQPSPASSPGPFGSGERPDAGSLFCGQFPSREVPPVEGTREIAFQVVYRQSVLDDIHAHGKSSPAAEVCGVLIGDIYSDRYSPWAYIQHSIRGNGAVGKETQVTITSETWTRIHETLERDFPGKKIVGWYHTHPGFGVFLSGMDLFIQDNFFNQPWQVASVYDPHSEDEGVFVWRGGKATRENFLVENDTAAVLGASGASGQIVEELTRRVRALERRLDFLLTGFLLLILIGLIAPLVWIYATPDIKLQNIERVFHSATTQPSAVPTANSASKIPPAGTTVKPVKPVPAALPTKRMSTGF